MQVRLEQETGAVFNTCLLNQYRHGRDHMSWHSDNEALYGPQPVIGSVSFGEARDFVLRQNDDHSHKLTFPLGNGDMLTMQVGRVSPDMVIFLAKYAPTATPVPDLCHHKPLMM